MAAAMPARNDEGASVLVVLTRGEGRKEQEQQSQKRTSPLHPPTHLAPLSFSSGQRTSLQYKKELKRVEENSDVKS